MACCGLKNVLNAPNLGTESENSKCYENKYFKFAIGVILTAAITLFAMAAWAPHSFAGAVRDMVGYKGAIAGFAVAVALGVAILGCAIKASREEDDV